MVGHVNEHSIAGTGKRHIDLPASHWLCHWYYQEHGLPTLPGHLPRIWQNGEYRGCRPFATYAGLRFKTIVADGIQILICAVLHHLRWRTEKRRGIKDRWKNANSGCRRWLLCLQNGEIRITNNEETEICWQSN